MILFLASVVLMASLVSWLLLERWLHDRQTLRIRHRIHVNGIRGKSTVTRMLAGMLREDDYRTVAKATGTACMVIDANGANHEIDRRGSARIDEQIRIIRRWTNSKTDALVMECMALKPLYQRVSEQRIIQSTIGVITNIREDHQDVMGETLIDIARSLASTCPTRGVLVTAEQRPELINVLYEAACSRGSRLIVANPSEVTDAELARFDYIAFKDNVAIGFEVAKLLGISRETAMAGMVRAEPDPGALRVQRMAIAGKDVIWANLFAVNDRESMIVGLERLSEYRTPSTAVVGILNNRADRERRALQFADVAVRDLSFDYLATFGAYEQTVTRRLRANGFDADRILNLGEDRAPSIEDIVDALIAKMPTEQVLLIGFVNIHTPQAELLMDYLAQVWAKGPLDYAVPSADAVPVARPQEEPSDRFDRKALSSPRLQPRRSGRTRVGPTPLRHGRKLRRAEFRHARRSDPRLRRLRQQVGGRHS